MARHDQPLAARLYPREYYSWRAARRRCFAPGDRRASRYGGRGITMCAEWRHDFYAFLRDLGPRPDGHSLNRIDNEGHYEPGNCNWATDAEQQRNRGNSRRITFKGETHVWKDWETILGLGRGTIRYRFKAGWPIEKIMTVPSNRQ